MEAFGARIGTDGSGADVVEVNSLVGTDGSVVRLLALVFGECMLISKRFSST